MESAHCLARMRAGSAEGRSSDVNLNFGIRPTPTLHDPGPLAAHLHNAQSSCALCNDGVLQLSIMDRHSSIGRYVSRQHSEETLQLLGRLAAAPLCSAMIMSPFAAFAQENWSTTANFDARYFASTNNIGTRTSQLYTPFGVQTTGFLSDTWKAALLLRSGTIFSHQTTPAASNTVNTLTDTNLTANMSYLGWNGITPTLSLAFNLPTATARATTGFANLNGKTDGDLVPTPAYGEGLNIGPTLGVNFNLNELTVLGIGVGHTQRGDFDQGTATGISRFDPGDVTTVNSTLGYRGERLSLQGTLSYSMESTTFQDNAPIYRAGDRILLGAKAGYAWTDSWASRVAVNFSHFASNDVPVTAGLLALVREAFNSNSNVTQATADLTYSTERYTIGPTLNFVYRDHNGYNPNTFQFLPAKTSWGVGVNGSYLLSQQFTLNASVQRLWVRENENPSKLNALNALIPGSSVPQLSSDIWIASLGGSYKF